MTVPRPDRTRFLRNSLHQAVCTQCVRAGRSLESATGIEVTCLCITWFSPPFIREDRFVHIWLRPPSLDTISVVHVLLYCCKTFPELADFKTWKLHSSSTHENYYL